MGCVGTKAKEPFDLKAAFDKTEIMQPWSGQYENQFEKEIYMAINVFRFNPPAWSVVINNVFNSTPELAKAKAMKKEILEKIKTLQKLPAISIDEAANLAARSNNAAVVAAAGPAKEGGNINAIIKDKSDLKPENYSEITMIQYKSDDAAEFITLALIKYWKKPKANAKSVEETKEKTKEEKKEENLLPVTKSEEEEKAAEKAKAEEDKKKKEA